MTIDMPRQSFNHGFWDGYHDAEAGRNPVWDGQVHPNAAYGAGYRYGKDSYRMGAPNSSDEAWDAWGDDLGKITRGN